MKKLYAIALITSFISMDVCGKVAQISNQNNFRGGDILSIDGSPVQGQRALALDISDSFTVTFTKDKTDYTYKVTLSKAIQKKLKSGDIDSIDLTTDDKGNLAVKATYNDYATPSTKLTVEKIESK